MLQQRDPRPVYGQQSGQTLAQVTQHQFDVEVDEQVLGEVGQHLRQLHPVLRRDLLVGTRLGEALLRARVMVGHDSRAPGGALLQRRRALLDAATCPRRVGIVAHQTTVAPTPQASSPQSDKPSRSAHDAV
jgi:hypothetical protein